MFLLVFCIAIPASWRRGAFSGDSLKEEIEFGFFNLEILFVCGKMLAEFF